VDTALDSQLLGTDLETELSLLTVATANTFKATDPRGPLDHLLESRRGSPAGSRLAARLARFEEQDKAEAASWLANTADDARTPPALVEQIQRDLDALASSTAGTARALIEEQIHSLGCRLDFRRGRPDFDAAIGWWKDREKTGLYAWVLHRFVQREETSAAATELAHEYFREHPETPRGTGPIFLALDLVERLGAETGGKWLEWLLGYLERSHVKWGPGLPADSNTQLLDLLVRHGVGDVAAHREQLATWVELREQREAMDKLPHLVARGRHFLVVWHYYERLAAFGLETVPSTDPNALISMSHAHQDELLLEWQARGRPVPAVVVRAEEGRRLSGEFLRYGRMLFRPRADPEFDGELELARGEFNEAAAAALPAVYELLIDSPAMPESLRSLLEDHRRKLLGRAVEHQARAASMD
jgi:hypothetical protein